MSSKGKIQIEMDEAVKAMESVDVRDIASRIMQRYSSISVASLLILEIEYCSNNKKVFNEDVSIIKAVISMQLADRFNIEMNVNCNDSLDSILFRLRKRVKAENGSFAISEYSAQFALIDSIRINIMRLGNEKDGTPILITNAGDRILYTTGGFLSIKGSGVSHKYGINSFLPYACVNSIIYDLHKSYLEEESRNIELIDEWIAKTKEYYKI